jgi:hypothetical protein
VIIRFFVLFFLEAMTVSSHQVVGSSRGRKPQIQANSSGATTAVASGALGGSSLDKPHEVMIKMEPHSEMSEVSQRTVQI